MEPLKEDPPIIGHCNKHLSTMDKLNPPNFMHLEPLKEDPPIIGHCNKHLSTMDKLNPPNFMHLEPLKEDNLYTLVPKYPLLRGFTALFLVIDD